MAQNKSAQHFSTASTVPLQRKIAAVAVAACFGSTAWANPTGGVVAHGAANITNPAANILNINTLSPKTIINWGSFSISVGELTRFVQPSALSAVLNRVVGGDPSAILGSLQSNGRVFLLNPNGIVFGAGSQINVAGLVASTLNLSDADFLAGRMNFTNGITAGSVVNEGAINAAGGPVYLVGNSVANNGLITNPNGEVVLAAGNSVELVNPGTPNLRVEISAPDNEARNLGTITAEAGRIGIYAGLIRQGGTVRADSAVAEGGRIMLKSTKRTDLEAGSVTSARGTSGGEIIALSDMSSGTTNVAGTLDASASAGNGGFIETSAGVVKVEDSATVTASGSSGAKAGKWLIDPNDFYIQSYGGGISGTALSATLDTGPTGTDFEIATATTPGGVPGSGDIHVNDNVVWTKGSTLTLTAERNILFELSTDTELDAGTTGNVVLNAAGFIQTNAGGGYIDIKANTLTANAATGMGNGGLPLQTQVVNAVLNNTTSNDVRLRNYGDLTFSASNPNGGVFVTVGSGDDLIVGAGNTVNAGSLNLDAGHIEILGNTTTSGNISLSAGLPSSIIVGNGANLQSTAGDVFLTSDNLNFVNAGMVKGNNIYLENVDFQGFDVGVNPFSLAQTISPASLAKLELNNPASGVVELKGGELFGGPLNINEAITFLPAKVQTLRLVGKHGVFQEPTAPITVKNLQAYSTLGRVLLDDATNAVDTLTGSALHEFRFRNSGNLAIVGDGISVDGGEFSAARVKVEVTAGNLTVSAPVSVNGSSGFSFSGGRGAEVELTASGAVTINDVVSATGGDGAEGGGGFAQITVTAGGGITVASSAVVSALGGSGSSGTGGNATVLLQNSSIASPITISGSVFASGGFGSSGGGFGNVTVLSHGGVNIASSALIQANGLGGFSFSEPGNVVITAYGGNVVQDGQIYASGGTGSGIRLSAVGSGGAIVQNNPSALLHASSNSAYGSGAEVRLEAVAGIGTPLAPVRINNLDEPDVFLQNSGGGDIAISFYGGTININDVTDVFNANPTGTYFIQSEQGGINLTAPFQPGLTPTPLLPGQSVELKALNGGTIDIGTGAGIVVPGTGTGNVVLTALGGGSINLASGTVIAGSFPQLNADEMDIQGQVLSSGGSIRVMPATPGRNIELGTSGPGGAVLALDNIELNNMTSWDGITVPAPGTSGGGLLIGDQGGGSGSLTFTGNVNSSAYLNVAGTSVAQSAGTITGGVSASAGTGNVSLQQAGNQITLTGGSTNGGSFSVLSASDLVVGDINTNGGNVNVSTSGSNLSFWSLAGPINAGSGSVQLTSGGSITDGRTGVDIIAASAALAAPGGVGTFSDPIETQLSSLSVFATGGSGEVGVINTGNLLLSSMAFSGTTAALESSGTLTTGNSIGATGNVALKGQTGLNIVHEINTGSTSNVTLEAGAGSDVVFSGAGGVNTSGGSISVTAGRDIIYGGSSQVNSSSGLIFFSAGNDVVFNTQRINNGSGSVQISATRDYIHNSTDSHNTSSGSLTIGAGRDFNYGSTSKLNTLSGNVTIQSVGNATFTAGGVNSSSGSILVQAGGAVDISGGAQLVSSGNSVGVEALGAAGAGVTLTGASTKVEGAEVSIVGTAGAAASSDNVGVRINGATVRSTSGSIDIIGQAGNGTSNNNGIRIDGGALISSAADVLLDGAGAGGTSDNSGVKVGNATVQSLGAGNIWIVGRGGAGSADKNDGVRLESGAVIGTNTGAVLIDGFGGAGGNDTVGIKLGSGSTVGSMGGGNITLYGEGGAGGDNNHGIRLEGTALVTSSGSIDISGFGGGSANENTGIKLAGGTLDATGTGSIVMSGEGGAGVANNEGIRVESSGLIRSADGAITLIGFGVGSGVGNEAIEIGGTVQTTGTGVITMAGTMPAGNDRILLQGSGVVTSASTITFTNGFTWAGGTIGGSGSLITPAGAVTNVTAAVGLASGKSWENAGTLNISGSGSIDLDATNLAPGIFSNQAGGVVNIASSAGWSFFSNPSQSGQIINAGTVNVDQNTSWEAAFNQTAGGALNIAAGKSLSMQNGENITGSASIGAGGTLWVSEHHGVDTTFSNMTIGGTGTLQVLGSSPVARFTNVSAPGVTLRLGSGGQIGIENGATVVGGLTLDSPAFGSAFSMSDATFAQATGNLTVPGGASYSGDNIYVAQAGDLLVPGVVNGGAGSLTLAAAAGDLKVIGGTVSADTINLLGTDIIVGDSAASTPSSVHAGSSLVAAALANLKIQGGSAAGANSRITSNGLLTVTTGGDLVLTGGAGANAWAKLSGDPDVLLAGIGGVVQLNAGSGTGSAAVIEALSTETIYLDLLNASSGGYFINGIEGVVYDPVTGTGFIAGGSPAVLGSNFMVTYGGVTLPPTSDLLGAIEEALQVPTQTLIVATTESTTPPDAEKDKDIFEEDLKKDKKKDAPVCR